MVITSSELLTTRPHKECTSTAREAGWNQEGAMEDGEGQGMLRPTLLLKEMLLNQALEIVSTFCLEERKFSRNPGVL